MLYFSTYSGLWSYLDNIRGTSDLCTHFSPCSTLTLRPSHTSAALTSHTPRCGESSPPRHQRSQCIVTPRDALPDSLIGSLLILFPFKAFNVSALAPSAPRSQLGAFGVSAPCFGLPAACVHKADKIVKSILFYYTALYKSTVICYYRVSVSEFRQCSHDPRSRPN